MYCNAPVLSSWMCSPESLAKRCKLRRVLNLYVQSSLRCAVQTLDGYEVANSVTCSVGRRWIVRGSRGQRGEERKQGEPEETDTEHCAASSNALNDTRLLGVRESFLSRNISASFAAANISTDPAALALPATAIMIAYS